MRSSWLVALLLFATSAAASPSHLEDFNTAWRAIERDYAYFEGKREVLRRVRELWRPRALRARTPEEFAAALEGSLDELRDEHVSVSPRDEAAPRRAPDGSDIWARWEGKTALIEAVRPSGEADVAGLRPGLAVRWVEGVPVEKVVGEMLRGTQATPQARDWALRRVLAGPRAGTFRIGIHDGTRGSTVEVERSGKPPTNGATLARRIGQDRDIGYIRFKQAFTDPSLPDQMEGMLNTLKDTRALVIDLRDVTARGRRDVTLGILAHFAAAEVPYQTRLVGRERVPDTVKPRDATPVRKPLLVLVDRWTAGEGEVLAAGLAAVAQARLVGTAMAGLRGELAAVHLPHSGLTVHFPAHNSFTLDGAPREKLRPQVPIDLAAPSGGPGDPILYQALKLLEK